MKNIFSGLLTIFEHLQIKFEISCLEKEIIKYKKQRAKGDISQLCFEKHVVFYVKKIAALKCKLDE